MAGIDTKTDTHGNLASITINAKKHPEAVQALKGLGLLEKSGLRKELYENPDNYISPEELRTGLKKHIRAIWKK